MRFRKMIVLLLSLVLAISGLSASISALDSFEKSTIELRYVIATKTQSTLSFSGTKAYCNSMAIGNTSTVEIVAAQTLQKKSGNVWNAVSGASWKKTTNSIILSVENTKSGLASGTYRLKTEFTLTTSSGQTETITVYSSEVAI